MQHTTMRFLPFLVGILALWTTDLCAYSLTGQKWPQVQLGDPVTITYSYSNLLDGGLLDPNDQPVPTWLIRASVEEAFGLWASVAPLHFVERVDSGPPPSDRDYAIADHPQIRLGYHEIDIFGGTKAHAFPPPPYAQGLGGDVHFDVLDRWALVGSSFYPDVLGAAVHELGHSLGLDHALDPNSIMYWTFPRMQGPGTGYLTADDIAGIRAVYGEGVGSVTPIPEPATFVLVLIAGAAIAGTRFVRRRQRAA